MKAKFSTLALNMICYYCVGNFDKKFDLKQSGMNKRPMRENLFIRNEDQE